MIPPSMTETCAARVAALIAADGREAVALRVSVNGGGCMGFSYGLDLDVEPMEGDVEIQSGSARLRVDGVSAPFLDGAVIDWVSDLMGERFEVRNPNAVATCGCGTSFAA